MEYKKETIMVFIVLLLTIFALVFILLHLHNDNLKTIKAQYEMIKKYEDFLIKYDIAQYDTSLQLIVNKEVMEILKKYKRRNK